MEVVINKCFGGFGLSPIAVKEYAKLSGFNVYGYVTDYSDLRKTIRYKDDGRKNYCIFWLMDDVGDNPTSDELNNANWFHETLLDRNDKILIKVVKKLKEKANGMCAKLRIVKIPDGVDYEIEEYDGAEHIAEKHRTWS